MPSFSQSLTNKDHFYSRAPTVLSDGSVVIVVIVVIAVVVIVYMMVYMMVQYTYRSSSENSVKINSPSSPVVEERIKIGTKGPLTITPLPRTHKIVCTFILPKEIIGKELASYEKNFWEEKVDCIYFSLQQREHLLLSSSDDSVWKIYSFINPHHELVRAWIFGLWYVYEHGGWFVRFMDDLPLNLFTDRNLWMHHTTIWIEKQVGHYVDPSTQEPFQGWSAIFTPKPRDASIHSILYQSLSILSSTKMGTWPSPRQFSNIHSIHTIYYTPSQYHLLQIEQEIPDWNPILFPFRWMCQRIPSPVYSLSAVYPYAFHIFPEPLFLPLVPSKIPKHIYLTWKNKNLPEKVMNNWKKLNPGYDVSLFTDEDCYQFLLLTFSKDYADFFKEIPFGPIKADWWRICILYAHGGVYADVDIVPMGIPLDTILSDCTAFTCIGNTMDHVFQAIMAFPAKDPILAKCIQLMYAKRPSVQQYLLTEKNEFASYYPYWSGTVDMYSAIIDFFQTSPIYGDAYYIRQPNKSNYPPFYSFDFDNMDNMGNRDTMDNIGTMETYVLKLAQEGCADYNLSTCMTYFNAVPLFKSRSDDYVSEWMLQYHHLGTESQFMS